MAVATKTGVGSLKELIDLGKKNPKQLTLGTNPGTVNSLFAVRLLKMAGVEVTEVPFKGGGEAKVALAGGHIDIHFDTVRVYQPLVEAQKCKILGISSGGRVSYFSDIPTFKEQGLDLTWGSWNGVFAPKKTPPEIIATLAKAIDNTVKDNEFFEMMKKNISVVRYLDRQEFTRALEAEETVIREVTTEMGLYKPKK
jgi:tripartite-type tricarboxylate transporter receptor subunit TctC